MKTIPVRHLVEFSIEKDEKLHRLSVRVGDQQYDISPDMRKQALPDALSEAMGVLRRKIAECHSDEFELRLLPEATMAEACRRGNDGFAA